MLHLNLMILLPLMYAVALYPIQIVTRPVYLIAVARHNQPHTAALPGCLAVLVIPLARCGQVAPTHRALLISRRLDLQHTLQDLTAL